MSLHLRFLLSTEFSKIAPSGDSNIKSGFKSVTIGRVPNRGGKPDGYTLQDVIRNVDQANYQLKMKDSKEPAAGKRLT